jgi:hypothetical protein
MNGRRSAATIGGRNALRTAITAEAMIAPATPLTWTPGTSAAAISSAPAATTQASRTWPSLILGRSGLQPARSPSADLTRRQRAHEECHRAQVHEEQEREHRAGRAVDPGEVGGPGEVPAEPELDRLTGDRRARSRAEGGAPARLLERQVAVEQDEHQGGEDGRNDRAEHEADPARLPVEPLLDVAARAGGDLLQHREPHRDEHRQQHADHERRVDELPAREAVGHAVVEDHRDRLANRAHHAGRAPQRDGDGDQPDEAPGRGDVGDDAVESRDPARAEVEPLRDRVDEPLPLLVVTEEETRHGDDERRERDEREQRAVGDRRSELRGAGAPVVRRDGPGQP